MRYYMTVHGIQQNEQSSPHQQDVLMGPGFTIEEAAEETDPFVEDGIFDSLPSVYVGTVG
jgi:hypothetical protein